MTPDEIKAFRLSKSLTQSEFGKMCGVGKSAVSQWESGATEPSGSTRVILEEFMSGRRALIPLTPLEERLLNELQARLGFSSREDLLKKLVLDALTDTPAPTSKKRGKKGGKGE